MTVKPMVAALLLGAAACAGARTGAARPAAAAPERIVPLVDHHQHLWSPRDVAPAPQLPAVELPPEVAALLRERAERFKDFDALEQRTPPTPRGWASATPRGRWAGPPAPGPWGGSADSCTSRIA